MRLQAAFLREGVTPELPNSHIWRFYRQAIPTGLAAEALVRRSSRRV